ncbi:biopolymer transporter ExbD [Hoeflea sp. WL0058]|uniref:Biopolymer transporter ExbD n=1 Tax=Flavimaribacter sediminis TaxID=2865987 RepID=A0AAE2ZR66_9HYPH|nr:biopolymer transporter ExbD [Flavimaribacter sediminis]MBW8639300.1 biopolymer transporter ExbD [Flavimaribacter sediminis]
MRFSRVAVKRRRLSLTSLIDVIFLLLLFFMLSSTFTRFSEVDIVAGRAGKQASVSKMPDVFIRLGKDNSWKVNGAELPQEAAVTELQRLEQAGAKTAVIVVREDVTSQALVDALELLANNSKLNISVAG